jgi:hypothetical protein
VKPYQDKKVIAAWGVDSTLVIKMFGIQGDCRREKLKRKMLAAKTEPERTVTCVPLRICFPFSGGHLDLPLGVPG